MSRVSRSDEERHKDVMREAASTFFDRDEVKCPALPVQVLDIVIAGDNKVEGLILHLADFEGRAIVPGFFLSEEMALRIEASIKRARLQFPGTFQ